MRPDPRRGLGIDAGKEGEAAKLEASKAEKAKQAEQTAERRQRAAQVPINGDAEVVAALKKALKKLEGQKAALPFLDPIPAELEAYHAVIARPVCLEDVRAKLLARPRPQVRAARTNALGQLLRCRCAATR
jgi:hypothetical protein